MDCSSYLGNFSCQAIMKIGRKYPVRRSLSRGSFDSFPLPSAGFYGVCLDSFYFRILISLIQNSKKNIFATVYDWSLSPRRDSTFPFLIFDALRAARRRGVDVCLLFSAHFTSVHHRSRVMRAFEMCRSAGFSCRFLRTKTFLHAKIFVSDEEFCLVGSHNWTSASLLYNHEATIYAADKSLAEKLILKFSQF